jgi:hypothetical protein
MNDIIKKIENYDKSHGTDFARIVQEKLNATKKVNVPYRRGMLHGMFLILNNLEVITPNEAIALLEEVSPDE